MMTICVGADGAAGRAGAGGAAGVEPAGVADGCAVDGCVAAGAGLRFVVGLRFVWPTATEQRVSERIKDQRLREGFIPELMGLGDYNLDVTL